MQFAGISESVGLTRSDTLLGGAWPEEAEKLTSRA
jgi:hypothetical protein